MKNKKNLILLWVLIIFFWLIVIYSKSFNDKSPQICIQKKCFDIEIADNPQTRQYWLMNRAYLPEWSGMLFVFEESGQHNFWMKNTLIPLDIIRINQDKIIIDIQQVSPCTTDPCPSYGPQENSLFVLELNAGISDKFWIKIWDKIQIK